MGSAQLNEIDKVIINPEESAIVQEVTAMSNGMFVIAPHWDPTIQTWVFDDLPTGLVAEPFVAGITEMLEMLLAEKGFPARERFRIVFSSSPFPGYDEEIRLIPDHEGCGGGTYQGVSPDGGSLL